MGGRALLTALLGIMVLSASIFYGITESSEDIMKNVDTYFSRQSAHNIAQSGVNMALRQISKDRFWRTGYALTNLMGGKLTITLRDTVFDTRNVVKVVATGITNYGTASEYRSTSTAFVATGFIPAAAKAAITTNNPISTLGDLTVDGRDHRINGSSVPNSGTLGIWTTRTLDQGGSSDIGGTAGGVDHVPSAPGDPSTIATNAVWPGGYPGSPDSILGGVGRGFPEGTLRAIAHSRIGGSQYVTNPALLNFPLRGVTYVELPSGGLWQSMNLEGNGILIVHNSWKNAGMKNLNSGTFKGLIIADDVVHIHSVIIGGLICLSPAPSEGNCIGNGTGSVLYSSEAITAATGGAGTTTSTSGGSGGAVIAWWE